jgi:Tfp pilus assembly protein PilF
MEPGSSASYVALSRLYMASHRDDQALKHLSDALEKNPRDPLCLLMTALIRSQKGDSRQAIEFYERLLKVKPDFAPALNNLACLYADVLHDLGKAYAMASRTFSPKRG